MSNAVAAFLRDEIALCEKSKALGICRQVSHDGALLMFRRAAEEIDALYSTLDELRAACAGIPDMQNKDKWDNLGARVNKALGR